MPGRSVPSMKAFRRVFACEPNLRDASGALVDRQLVGLHHRALVTIMIDQHLAQAFRPGTIGQSENRQAIPIGVDVMTLAFGGAVLLHHGADFSILAKLDTELPIVVVENR